MYFISYKALIERFEKLSGQTLILRKHEFQNLELPHTLHSIYAITPQIVKTEIEYKIDLLKKSGILRIYEKVKVLFTPKVYIGFVTRASKKNSNYSIEFNPIFRLLSKKSKHFFYSLSSYFYQHNFMLGSIK